MNPIQAAAAELPEEFEQAFVRADKEDTARRMILAYLRALTAETEK